jgi:DtxR family Mn-dependent transcriptional regulator
MPLLQQPIPLLALAALAAWALVRLLRARREASHWRERVLDDDLLKHVLQCELDGRRPTLASIGGALGVAPDDAAAVLARLTEAGLVRLSGEDLKLSDDGRSAAMHLLRAHRLWERHLAEDSGYPETEWHRLADAREHELTPAETNELAARLGHPTHDPHGDPIPSRGGEVVDHGGKPLTTFSPPAALRIKHVEDEPEAIYAQLVAEGLAPGMTGHLVEVTPERVRLWTDLGEHVLAPLLAANVHAVAWDPQKVGTPESKVLKLDELPLGSAGLVQRLGPQCRGAARRRLMDLGLLPGTILRAELRSPSGDPTAYRLRGALIALRAEQAEHIVITVVDEEGAAAQEETTDG